MHIETRRAFDTTIHEIIGPAATTQDVEDTTHEYNAFDPDLLDLDPDHGDTEVTPEYGDNFVRAEILLPMGGAMARGRVTKKK